MNWPSQARTKNTTGKQQQSGAKNQKQLLLAAQLARHPNDNDISFKQVKKKVEHNRSQMIQLMESQSYCQEAMQLNRTAVEMMRHGQIQEASLRLAEAERILEYAANSGRQISRSLIITVLHNEACCNQLSWQLQRCSNYIQALIYNINCKIKSIETEEQSSLNREELEMEQISMKLSLSSYYLVYCAINSQLKQNEAALSAAKKANYLLRTTSTALSRLTRLIDTAEKNLIRILNQLGRLKQNIEDVEIHTLLQITKHYLRLWKNRCSFPNFQLRSISNKLKQYSIGNLLQLEPMLSQYQSKQQKWSGLSYEIVLKRVMIVSMSYFTIATELRLLAIELGGGKLEAKMLKEYEQSQCYHLIAIILVTYYIPFDILYLEHILTSFSNHYHIQLDGKSSLSSQFKETQLFQLLLESSGNNQVKGSTTGNSQKQQSPATSHFSLEPDKHQNKLQYDVRESLKGQNLKENRQFAKLNNYYYVRPQIQIGKSKKQKDKDSISSNPSKIANLRKACLTSIQSPQKTPIGYSPVRLSPRNKVKSPKSQRSKLSSNRCSKGKVTKVDRPQKVLNVMQEYFSNDRLSKSKQPFRNNKKIKDKQDKGTFSSKKIKQVHSKTKDAEKLRIPSDRRGNQINIKDNKQIKGLKSPIKMKDKFTEAKTNKKATADSYY